MASLMVKFKTLLNKLLIFCSYPKRGASISRLTIPTENGASLSDLFLDFTHRKWILVLDFVRFRKVLIPIDLTLVVYLLQRLLKKRLDSVHL
jgi:hypothetical protein